MSLTSPEGPLRLFLPKSDKDLSRKALAAFAIDAGALEFVARADHPKLGQSASTSTSLPGAPFETKHGWIYTEDQLARSPNKMSTHWRPVDAEVQLVTRASRKGQPGVSVSWAVFENVGSAYLVSSQPRQFIC